VEDPAQARSRGQAPAASPSPSEASTGIAHYTVLPLGMALERATSPLIKVSTSWQYCMIPTNRPLWHLLQEVVRHSYQFPTHGADCVCMDEFIRQMRISVDRVLPTREAEREKARQRMFILFSRLSRHR
jgi:hypothetical protein